MDVSYFIQSARLMITDYSSMCSDFYYLKKPVIFYHFDLDEYVEKSWFGDRFARRSVWGSCFR